MCVYIIYTMHFETIVRVQCGVFFCHLVVEQMHCTHKDSWPSA